MTQPQGRGRKSRIVIDVDRMQAETRGRGGRRGGRAGRLLSVTGLVVVGVVLAVLLGSYVWWRGFRQSPPYSLALLLDAAQRDDPQAVESLIDADQVAQGFVPQVIESLGGPGSALPPQARASLTNVLPQLLPRVRETMRDEVARALKGASPNESSSLPFFARAIGVRQMTTVNERGEDATVNFKVGERPVELAMRRDGERWKVVTVKDPQLASEIAGRLAASLPAAPQAPQPQTPARRRGGR